MKKKKDLNELTELTALGLAPAFNKHFIISVSPSEAAITKGVTPHEPVFGSAPAYAIEIFKHHDNHKEQSSTYKH